MTPSNNFFDKNTLDLLFTEIENNLNNKLFFSALIIALTVPDILGNCAYPELSGTGHSQERYEKWFNANVRNLFGLLYSDDFYKDTDRPGMSGVVCYR